MDNATASTQEFLSEPKKKILILSSNGGYGHRAASLSIQEICKDRYVFQEIFPIEELNRFGKTSGEGIYNALIKNNWIWTTNFISNKLAPLLFMTKKERLESFLVDCIQANKPDLVLSLIPFVNSSVSEATRKLDIPYLLVTTDNDLTNWVRGLERAYHPCFAVTIGQEHSLTRGLLLKQGISEEQIVLTGLPVHPDFSKQRPREQIKKDLNITLDKPIVTIMMGGAGGKSAYAYAQELKSIGIPLHVIICTGNNTSLYHKMQTFTLEKGDVTFSVLGFTNQVADFMQISDLLITKPGPGTINEAMVKRLPILVDNAHSALSWERVNLELVEKRGIGRVLHQVKDVNPFALAYLQDPDYKKSVHFAYEQQQRLSFDENIRKVLSNLLFASSPVI